MLARRLLPLKKDYFLARNLYFQAIKAAKQGH